GSNRSDALVHSPMRPGIAASAAIIPVSSKQPPVFTFSHARHSGWTSVPNLLIPVSTTSREVRGDLQTLPAHRVLLGVLLLPASLSANTDAIRGRFLILMACPWPEAGALRTPRRMHGLLGRRPSVRDSWILEIIAGPTGVALPGKQQSAKIACSGRP